MGIFVALLVLSVLIFFHELGHFTAARFFGVQVDVFSIGFGKKLYSKMIGKTEWSFSAIPLGGYVKMKGQDDTDPTQVSYDDDSYNTKKPWQRIIILLAGPFANFALALFCALAYLILNFLVIREILTAGWVLVPLQQMLVAGVVVNISLGLINLIPIPPLDGSKVLMGLLPPQTARSYAKLEPFGFILLLGLFYTGIISKVILPIITFANSLLLG